MTVGVSTKHPDWLDRADEWALMRHAARGEKAIKGAASAYLPVPSGFKKKDANGASRERDLYEAYQKRAQFLEVVAPTVAGMVGVIHRAEAKIEMPASMEPIWEAATPDGLPLEALHRRITAELLLTGRHGLLVDTHEGGADLPYIAGYSAEAIINWSESRDFFVLDESGLVRNGFAWETLAKFRVLELNGAQYGVRTYQGEGFANVAEALPTARGGQPLTEIPFVVIGPKDLSLCPAEPPLIGVARAAISYYQLSADYRWQLFMTGQETLFVINGEAPDAVGAGVVVTLNGGGDGNPPDAKYVGPAGTGIEAHRIALQDEKENAVSAGARIFDSNKKAAESGDALKIRYAAQTATLTTVAQASAAGLEKALRYVAMMTGADPDKVVVTPNLSFMDAGMSPAEAEQLVRVWQAGAISYQTLYDNLQRGEIASAERTAEQEFSLIDQEDIDRSGEQRAAFLPAAE